jgi:hypothetical protein
MGIHKIDSWASKDDLGALPSFATFVEMAHVFDLVVEAVVELV